MKKSIKEAAAFLTLSAVIFAGTLNAGAAATTKVNQAAAITVAAAAAANNQTLSRGGMPIQSQKKSVSTENAAPKFGQLIEWSKVNNLIPRGTTIEVKDLNTGKSFKIKRTYGTNHLDGEAVTEADTNIIKSIWGGFSWERRPVVVSINGQYIAASMTAMPHAGLDSAPAEATVKNRSEGYGTGINLDAVKDNGMDGVIDIHFLNSTRHLDNHKDQRHQAAILKAAGK